VEPKSVASSQVELSEVMGIEDSNLAGAVHGGVIMKLVDTAGGLAAIKHAGGPVVTAQIDEMSFIEPVNLGDLVTVKASVNDVGRTSLEVGVRVETENLITGHTSHTSTAYLVFVALGSNRKPTPVPPLIAESPDEKRRMREAKVRRQARLARREAILDERKRAGEI
jgi:uncharacterized protein (TIGR00369 family)